MTVPRTLLVNGFDLRAQSGVNITRLDIMAPGTRRGQHDAVPGARGQVGAQRSIDAYTFEVAIEVFGGSEAGMLINLHNLASVCLGTNGLGTLERRLPNAGGTYDAYTANGCFEGFTGIFPEQMNAQSIKCSLQFTNLDGGWTRSSDGVFVIP